MHPLPRYASVLHLLPSYGLNRARSDGHRLCIKRGFAFATATLWVIPLPDYGSSDTLCDLNHKMALTATLCFTSSAGCIAYTYIRLGIQSDRAGASELARKASGSSSQAKLSRRSQLTRTPFNRPKSANYPAGLIRRSSASIFVRRLPIRSRSRRARSSDSVRRNISRT